MCECLLWKCVCVYMHVEESVFCVEGGRRGEVRGRSAVCRFAVFEWWLSGGVRTRWFYVWEPRAPHFSYIVPPLLQTVNATKDAQPIVARDSWGGRAMGRRQARRKGLALPEPPIADSHPFLSSSPVLSPLCHPFLFSPHSALPLSPSQEDLSTQGLVCPCLTYKRIKPTQGPSFLH